MNIMTPRNASSLTAIRWIRPYALAVGAVAAALGLALVAELQSQVRCEAETDSRRGAHLFARGKRQDGELPARRERLRGEAGRLPRVRQCREGARHLLGGHQRAAARQRRKEKLKSVPQSGQTQP